jgi:hypothetical protein
MVEGCLLVGVGVEQVVGSYCYGKVFVVCNSTDGTVGSAAWL